MSGIVRCAVCDAPVDSADADNVNGRWFCENHAPEDTLENDIDAMADEHSAMHDDLD